MRTIPSTLRSEGLACLSALNCPELLEYKIWHRKFSLGPILADTLPSITRNCSTRSGMRLFGVLPIFSLLLGVHASSVDSREPAPHRLDVRDTPDVCANVFYEYGFAVSTTQCLCLSTLPYFIQTNNIVSLAIYHGVRQSDIYGTMESSITAAAAKLTCPYPEHSSPTCVDGSPCGFTCMDGFTPSPPNNPTTCVCSAPNVICNGQCVAPGACPSNQVASKKRRRWVGSGSCTDMGPGWVACGVLDGGPRAWECVNAGRDLESCGGCTVPLTAYSPVGKDCSALPGVADVSCLGGECAVHRCLPGYVPAFDGTSCIRKHHIPQSQFSDAEDVPARVYGLEHVPLGRH